MKAIFFSILITCCGLACSDNAGLIPSVNEEEPMEEGEVIPVSFNVGFTKEVIPFRAGSSEEYTLKDFSLKHLEHLIFKEDKEYGEGYFLYKKYTVIDSDGSISCELPEGNYLSRFIAYNSGVFLQPLDIIGGGWGNAIYFGFQVRTDNGEGEENFIEGDQFFNETTYTVEKDTENSHPIVLERIVGKIEIVFEDIIPGDVEKIDVYGSGDFASVWGYYNNKMPSTTVRAIKTSYTLSESDKIAPGYTISSFVYESSIRLLKLDVKEEKDHDSSYKSIDFKNVNIPRGKLVRYKGKFFEGTVDFDLYIDDLWDDTEEHTY
jgi:hypothetical protein